MEHSFWLTKACNWEVKSEATGTFSARAATWRKDRDGDRFAPGCFSPSIKERKGMIPVFVSHDHQQWVGATTSLAEDEKGLTLEGRLFLESVAGREAWSRMKECDSIGFPLGLSVGFITKDAEYDEASRTRLIKEVDLWEVSFTPFPAQYGTGMDGFKARNVEQLLRDVGGCSKESAKRVLSMLTPYLAADAAGNPLIPVRDVREARHTAIRQYLQTGDSSL